VSADAGRPYWRAERGLSGNAVMKRFLRNNLVVENKVFLTVIRSFRGQTLQLGPVRRGRLRAYARMLNTLDIDAFAPVIADDFQYASQMVLDEMTSKGEFLEYMRKKLVAMSSSTARPFAEMGQLSTYPFGSCVVVAQGDRNNLVCTVIAKVSGGKVSRLDLCIVPPPWTVARTGDYPI
jgi:hypothetical protein